jgi:cell wall-associated NlpC family hydrolase
VTALIAWSTFPLPARVTEIATLVAPQAPVRADATSFTSALAGAQQLVAPQGGSETNPVVDTALRYVGTPYVWGGNDPVTGLDCSGFTRLVYGTFGVALPRVSTDQATTGAPVASLADARAGDLLAFGSPVDHVAIYLGDGRMVHAAGTGKDVRVDDVARQPAAIRRLTIGALP